MANKFNIGDVVRYTGSDPMIPADATGTIEFVEGPMIMAVNHEKGYILGITDEVAELVTEAPAGPKVGDSVKVLNDTTPIMVFAQVGSVGTVTETSGEALTVEFPRDISEGGPYLQIIGVSQVEVVVSEAPEAPLTDGDVTVGDRVRLTDFTEDTKGLTGVVTEVPGASPYFEVELDEAHEGRDDFLLTRDEFELIEDEPVKDEAPKGDSLAELLFPGNVDLADFEVLARRLTNGAKAAGNGTPLQALLLDLAIGFAVDTSDTTKAVIRELIGKDA